MAVHHIDEHIDCYNYSRSKGPVDVMKACSGTRLSKDVRVTELLCVVSGRLALTTQRIKDHVIEGGHIVLMPPSTKASVDVLDDSHLMVFMIDKPVQICDHCPLESLSKSLSGEDADPNLPSILKFNSSLEDYFGSFIKIMGEGMKCSHYLELKSRELMFILRGFYTRAELASFFRPLISNDTDFSDFVLKNYRNVKTVEELARLSNYSRSGFKAHFRRTFGVSTVAWLREKKAHNVYHELTSTTKPLMQISKEYNFSSVSHMSIFCREFFGMPPGKIRKEAGKNSSAGGKIDPGNGVAKLPLPILKIDTVE